MARAFYIIGLVSLLISLINFWMLGLKWKESFTCGYFSLFFVIASGIQFINCLKHITLKLNVTCHSSLSKSRYSVRNISSVILNIVEHIKVITLF